MGSINWLSMIIAILLPMIIGFIYYHKALFGKAWMDSIGMTEEKAKQANMPVVFGLSFVMAFLLAFFMLNFCNGLGQEGQYDTFKHGAFHGVFLTVVVVGPVLVTNGLFEQRSWKNMLINIGYWAITLALMGGVLDAMNHWPG
jgi:hypothetical protein